VIIFGQNLEGRNNQPVTKLNTCASVKIDSVTVLNVSYIVKQNTNLDGKYLQTNTSQAQLRVSVYNC